VARFATLLTALAWVRPVLAEDTCAAAYEESQVARSEGRLRAAQRELRSCTRVECPEFIRTDCARWLVDVESALPSVVIVVTSQGREVEDVKVAFDGEVLTTRLDGSAIPVDPGRHVFTFERAGDPPLELAVVIREGDKRRAIAAALRPAVAVAARTEPARPEPRSGRGVLPHVLLGIGALGIGGFATFGLLGRSERTELEESCSPRCSDEKISAVQSKFLIADVSLSVGVLALAGGAYLLLSAPSSSSAQVAKTSRPAAGPLSASVSLDTRGGACTARWSF
jgi:hypothetical protein